jgi:hypothetical protein
LPPISTETRLTSNMLIYFFPSTARLTAISIRTLVL